MECTTWMATLFCVCAVGRSQGCVLTDSVHQVEEGSDVPLTCTFSTCPDPLDHTVHVDWQFNDTNFFFYYPNQSFGLWPNAELTGDILAGDFSVLLRSVALQHSGTYQCFVRPFHSPLIYKNRTLLIVDPCRSGWHITKSSSPLRVILVYSGVGLMMLAVGGALGVGVYRRRGRGQQSDLRTLSAT